MSLVRLRNKISKPERTNHMVNVSSLFGQIVSEIFTAVNFDNLVAHFQIF